MSELKHPTPEDLARAAARIAAGTDALSNAIRTAEASRHFLRTGDRSKLDALGATSFPLTLPTQDEG
jgi:hypothetical protein